MDLKQHSKKYLKNSEYLSEIQAACRDLLQNSSQAEAARNYINNRVSVANQEKFQFGYFPKDEDIDILLEKVDKNKLLKLGLIYNYHVQNDDCRVNTVKGIMGSHNIITSYKDIYGNNVAFVGRSTLQEDFRKQTNIEKYRYTKGFIKALHLFGLSEAKLDIIKKGFVIIVEGQIDCVTCHEYGIHNVVALGGSSLSRYQFNLLRRLTDNFCLLLDSDLPGQKATAKIIKKYAKYANIKTINLPNNYKDVDVYLHEKQDISIFS